MNPTHVEILHNFLWVSGSLATGAALSELWRWALRSNVGPIQTLCNVVQDAYPESCGFVARHLGITQVEDGE